MGAHQSSFESVGPLNRSLVQAVHTKSEWKIYLEKTKGSSKLMVVDFTATWCGPCKFFEPTVNELALKYPDVIFVKIDVDELPDVANEFKVTAIPGFVLIKDGKEIDKVVGVNKEALQMKIEKCRL